MKPDEIAARMKLVSEILLTQGRKMKATFERTADQTLDDVRAVYAQRGAEYADSWALDRMVSTLTEATLARFGVKLETEQVRLVLLAALVDIKDSRLGGPWKKDSIVDGIAYRAAYCQLREEYESLHAGGVSIPPQSTPTSFVNQGIH